MRAETSSIAAATRGRITPFAANASRRPAARAPITWQPTASTARSGTHISLGTCADWRDDPRLVFKISADSRLTDDALQSKGLQHLGESSGWDYFVLPHDENATSFRSALEAYRSSEHGKSFFGLIKDIEPYGPEDRRGTGLEPDQTLTFPLLVDIHLWPASSGPEARERLTPVRALLGDQELGADEQPAFLLVRASVDEATLSGLLVLPAVERVRVPPSPYLSPTDWIGPSLWTKLSSHLRDRRRWRDRRRSIGGSPAVGRTRRQFRSSRWARLGASHTARNDGGRPRCVRGLRECLAGWSPVAIADPGRGRPRSRGLGGIWICDVSHSHA